jgi:hypothetical protein
MTVIAGMWPFGSVTGGREEWARDCGALRQ